MKRKTTPVVSNESQQAAGPGRPAHARPGRARARGAGPRPFAWAGTYNERVRQAYRLVARHVYRGLGEFGYAAFDHVNAAYFGGRLPEPLILWDITEYGGCLAFARPSAEGPPVIKLHRSLVEPADVEREDGVGPWGIPLEVLGPCYAYYTVVHECMHVSVEYLLGGFRSRPDRKSYWTSHNNPLWVGECNRIAGLMGVPADYRMKTYRRVATGEVVNGKPVRKQVYGSDGPGFEGFPHCTPGASEFYRAGRLPFAWPGGTDADGTTPGPAR
jgi:hypothetical protein